MYEYRCMHPPPQKSVPYVCPMYPPPQKSVPYVCPIRDVTRMYPPPQKSVPYVCPIRDVTQVTLVCVYRKLRGVAYTKDTSVTQTKVSVCPNLRVRPEN
jgi:hypothetical protein